MKNDKMTNKERFYVTAERTPDWDDEEVQARLAQVYRIILESGQRASQAQDATTTSDTTQLLTNIELADNGNDGGGSDESNV